MTGYTYDNFTDDHVQFLQNISKQQDPVSFREASSQPHWVEVMHKEIKALDDTNTWSLVTLPPNKRLIGCKWAYKTKFLPEGSIDKHKAWLVAKGYS